MLQRTVTGVESPKVFADPGGAVSGPDRTGLRGGRGRGCSILIVVLLLVLLMPGSSSTGAGPGPVGTGPPEVLSSAQRNVISAALGRDDRAYWTRSRAGLAVISNARQDLSARFTTAGPEVSTRGVGWRLGLSAIGRGDDLLPVPTGDAIADANGVSYRRGPINEWYRNGPAGLEQGVTVDRRPEGVDRGPLTLAVGERGGMTGHLDADGRGVVLTRGPASVAYRGLSASDADGTMFPTHLELVHGHLLVRVNDQGAHYPLTVDPLIQAAKLIGSDGATNEELGFSVAISGDRSTIVAGTPGARVGDNPSQGAAYVFAKSPGLGGLFAQAAKLRASDGGTSHELGYSVAISADGSTIVTAARLANVGTNPTQGATYVYVKPTGGWASNTNVPLIEAARLTAADGTAMDELGNSVAVSADGTTIVAGAPRAKIGRNITQGAAYVFVEPAAGWASSASPVRAIKLTASDGAPSDELGSAVAVSADGSTILAAARLANIGTHLAQGAGYVYAAPAGGWASSTTTSLAQQAKLVASNGSSGDEFGSAVSMSADGGTILATARFAKVGPHPEQGAGYVFTRPATGGWVSRPGTPLNQQAELISDGATYDEFGSSAAISGDGSAIVVGAPNAAVGTNLAQGVGYLFREPTGGWAASQSGPLIAAAELTASDGVAFDEFGNSVAVSADGSTIVCGAPLATVGGNTDQGVGYVFGDGGTNSILRVLKPGGTSSIRS